VNRRGRHRWSSSLRPDDPEVEEGGKDEGATKEQ
jgi:hypothetical protein